MVFVRYELGAYLHYTSVQLESGAPWRLDSDKRVALEQRYLASGICQAIFRADDNVARMLVLSKLLGRDSLLAA